MKMREIAVAKPGRPRKDPKKAASSNERRVNFDQRVVLNGGARFTVILPDDHHVAAISYLSKAFALKRGPATARAVLDLARHLGMPTPPLTGAGSIVAEVQVARVQKDKHDKETL